MYVWRAPSLHTSTQEKKKEKRKFKSCHKHPGEEAKQRRYHSDWHVAASGQISV